MNQGLGTQVPQYVADLPQPKKSNTCLVIIIVILVVLVVLCCCCAVVGVVPFLGGVLNWLYNNGDQLLGTSSLLNSLPAV